MRISTSLRLLALCLFAGSLPASPLAARSPAHKPKNPQLLIHKEFDGYGKTEQLARKQALERACQWLKENSGLEWSADPDYLIDPWHKMVQFSEAEDKKLVIDDEPMGDVKFVKMQLEIMDYQVRDIQKQAQQQRMKERQKVSLLGLLGMMGLIGVVGGYLRVDEATKGYCTRLLRFAAVGILAVIIAGLCMAG